jgi:NADH-quinone oxidoreductase subunit K
MSPDLVVTPTHYLALSAVLFAIGMAGVLVRKNVFSALMGVELMLNGANLAFVAFARLRGEETGQAVATVIIALAAAEVCVGLALIVALRRLNGSMDLDDLRELKG